MIEATPTRVGFRVEARILPLVVVVVVPGGSYLQSGHQHRKPREKHGVLSAGYKLHTKALRVSVAAARCLCPGSALSAPPPSLLPTPRGRAAVCDYGRPLADMTGRAVGNEFS
uniref:Uncharacterized protein n=1 Tax=Knipowitschia caucasica TaxID=637954 RepID=A0AAV2KY63_KNICA